MNAKARKSALSFVNLMRRQRWSPIPSLIVLTGGARFLRQRIQQRVIHELFGDAQRVARSILRLDASKIAEGMLATVLDELRTVSILSEERLVIVGAADAFLAAHRDDLLPFVSGGFSGGHLILDLEKTMDGRTRFAKTVAEHGWVVECRQPFDRPPPWQGDTPPWKNELSEWIVDWAAGKDLQLDLRDAHYLQERVGNDLGVLDESLEKIKTFLGSGSNCIDTKAIEAVTGEVREDSIFDLVDQFITADRPGALDTLERLYRNGYHPAKGSPVHDPASIALLFIGALVARLRSLRRAHAVSPRGGGADQWLELRLTTRPFMDRFRRDLQAMPSARLERTHEALLRMDRGIKTGSDPKTALMLLLAKV